MIEAALLANPWYAAALVLAVYIFGYALALFEARLYLAGVDEHILYRGGYPLEREYVDAWGRRRPASWRFLALLVLVDAAESLEHLRNIALFRAVLDGDSVTGKIELARRATLTTRYVEWYGLTAIFLMIAVVAGSWFCAGGALGCVVAAQRLRDWVIVRT